MLRLAAANLAVQAALAKANELAICISVSVCDAYGHLIAHQRMDNVLGEANYASMGKAIAAAALGGPSGEDKRVDFRKSRVGGALAEGAPFVRLRGGLPIIQGGEVEGGLGVAGADAHEDEKCAQAGIQVLEERVA